MPVKKVQADNPTSVNNVNRTVFHDGIRIRVMCPECNAGGAHYLEMAQPKCHVCEYSVLMEPASNTRIECTWEEAVREIHG
jgi:hypothetical protein